MAQSTYALLSGLLPWIEERALKYEQHNAVMPQLVTVYADMQGMIDRRISDYKQVFLGIRSYADTDDIGSTALDRQRLATLTPAEYGARIDLTDQRVESDLEGVVVDATEQLGYGMRIDMEKRLAAHVPNLTGGTIGAGSGAFTLADVFKARSLLEVRGIQGPYNLVMHPYQYLDVFSTFIDLDNPAEPAYRNQALSGYTIPGLADVRAYVSTMVPRLTVNTLVLGSASGGTYTLKFGGGETTALAHDANAATVQAALRAATIAGGSEVIDAAVAVTGTTTKTITWTTPFNNYQELQVGTDSTTGGSAGANAVVAETGGKAYAGLFNRQAIALDLRRGLRLELDRDASARSTELVMSTVYANGLWRADYGTNVFSDASIPS